VSIQAAFSAFASRIALACLALCGSAQAGGTLTVCSESSPEGFDVAQYELSVTIDAAGIAIYDQLLGFAPGTTRVVPALVEKWEISPDGLVYTLHLRPGVKFHATPWFSPTRDFNADDVIFSIERMRDKSHPAHAAARNGFVYWEGMSLSALIKSLEKLDAMTVRFTLNRPEAPFLADLAIPSVGSIVSAEYAGQLMKSGQLEQLNTLPVGTGPFVFKSYQKDAVIRYAANIGYWGGAPKVDTMIFAITLDPNVRVQRLKAGECLAGIAMKSESAGAFEKDPNVRLRAERPLQTNYLAPNAKHRFVGDKRFRQALWLAIDKQAYIASVYSGQAAPAASFLPPAMWGYDGSLADRHDLAKARQLVAASGYDGRELTLYTRIGGSADLKRAAELLQSDWARIGIKLRIELMEIGELYKRTGKGEHDIALLAWASDNGDPDNFLTPNLACAAVEGGGNKSQWCDKAFDALIDAARVSSDLKQRTELYHRAQRMIYEEAPVIPLVSPVIMMGLNKRVQGYVANPFGNSDFRGVGLRP